MADIVKEILNSLDSVEKENNVKILYACESGSRAWGFPSVDSDYDIRFIYVRPLEWYLSIDVELKRDVIEIPLTSNKLDIAGWDLRKTLKLLVNSNPALLEWLQSPIVYKEELSTVSEIRRLAGMYFSLRNCAFHYYNLATSQKKVYFGKDVINLKKYFYILRPIFALEWIEKDLGMVPTEFSVLVREIIAHSDIADIINDILQEKMNNVEMEKRNRITLLDNYIEERLKYFDDAVKKIPEREFIPPDSVNGFFQKTVSVLW